jgi:hypothetical protein
LQNNFELALLIRTQPHSLTLSSTSYPFFSFATLLAHLRNQLFLPIDVPQKLSLREIEVSLDFANNQGVIVQGDRWSRSIVSLAVGVELD